MKRIIVLSTLCLLSWPLFSQITWWWDEHTPSIISTKTVIGEKYEKKSEKESCRITCYENRVIKLVPAPYSLPNEKWNAEQAIDSVLGKPNQKIKVWEKDVFSYSDPFQIQQAFFHSEREAVYQSKGNRICLTAKTGPIKKQFSWFNLFLTATIIITSLLSISAWVNSKRKPLKRWLTVILVFVAMFSMCFSPEFTADQFIEYAWSLFGDSLIICIATLAIGGIILLLHWAFVFIPKEIMEIEVKEMSYSDALVLSLPINLTIILCLTTGIISVPAILLGTSVAIGTALSLFILRDEKIKKVIAAYNKAKEPRKK